ncbi:MAG: LysM peptidoglycan-binding domain-containing protein [Chloroflexota bacterium]
MFTKRLFLLLSFVFVVTLITGCGLIPSPGGGDDETPTPIPGYPDPDPDPVDPDPDPGPDPDPDPVDPDPVDPDPDPVFETISLGEPTILAAPDTSSNQGDTVVHTVAPNEWLVQIARCYGASYTAVLSQNPQLFNTNFILPGTNVTVPNVGSDGPIFEQPCVTEDTVEAGETWISLAAKHDTTTQLLTQANPGSLFTGRTILVPSSQEQQAVAQANPSQDLIYVRDGNLAIWQSENGETAVYESFNNLIIELVVNDAGTWAIAKMKQAENEAVNVVLINLVEKNMGIVVADLPLGLPSFNQTTMMISDQQAAFVIQQDTTLDLSAFSIGTPLVVNTLEGLTHNISTDFVPNINLFEGPDDSSFLLFDGSGIYRYAVDLADGEQIIWQPDGEQDFGTSLRPVAWSPAGQYLLVEVFYIEGFNYGILDATTDQWVPIENSGGYILAGTAVWQSDGNIDVINPWIPNGSGFTLTTYQPQTADGSLSLNQVSEDELDAPADLPTSNIPNVIMRAGPLSDGETYVSFLVGNPDSTSHLMLRLDRENKALVEHMAVNSFAFFPTFSNSGNVLLLQQVNNNSTIDQVAYVDMAEKVTFSILDLVGPDSRNFYWID